MSDMTLFDVLFSIAIGGTLGWAVGYAYNWLNGKEK